MSIGDRLAQKRAGCGTTIEEMSAKTGIGLPYLQALESNDFGALPGRAFGKLYIRAYAEVLEFDPGALIGDYDEQAARRDAEVPKEVQQDEARSVWQEALRKSLKDSRNARSRSSRTRKKDGSRSSRNDPDKAVSNGPPAAGQDASRSEVEVSLSRQQTLAAESQSTVNDSDSRGEQDSPVAALQSAHGGLPEDPAENSGGAGGPSGPGGPTIPGSPRQRRSPIFYAGVTLVSLGLVAFAAWLTLPGLRSGGTEEERLETAIAQVEPEAVVAQAEPEALVEQAEPEAVVAQAEPVVAQAEPEAVVAQAEPVVAQAEPEAVVAQAEPVVAQAEPEAVVAQAEPVDGQAEPEAVVAQAEPVVAQAEPEAVVAQAEVAPDLSGPLTVSEFAVGERVVNRSVQGRGDEFEEGSSPAFLTRVLGGVPGQRIRHVWFRDGRRVQAIELQLGGSHWRTHSSKTLWGTGPWSVEAQDAAGQVLARASFTCVPKSR